MVSSEGVFKGQWQGYFRDLKVLSNPAAAASHLCTAGRAAAHLGNGAAVLVGLRLQFRKEKLFPEGWNRYTVFFLGSENIYTHANGYNCILENTVYLVVN